MQSLFITSSFHFTCYLSFHHCQMLSCLYVSLGYSHFTEAIQNCSISLNSKSLMYCGGLAINIVGYFKLNWGTGVAVSIWTQEVQAMRVNWRAMSNCRAVSGKRVQAQSAVFAVRHRVLSGEHWPLKPKNWLLWHMPGYLSLRLAEDTVLTVLLRALIIYLEEYVSDSTTQIRGSWVWKVLKFSGKCVFP